MRLTRTGPGLTETVFAALDRRLQQDVDHPVALALSGGGDSLALLDLAARWAADRGRRLVCLTVDHRLNPDSRRWSAFAADAACRAGADWRGIERTKPLQPGGLPAAARRFRHARLADAARAVGARVILTGHTADDDAEAEWMRAEGSSVGRLRDWSPSPAWPEGRGLMLLRPLLAVRRTALRDHLTERGLEWIDDPANEDIRFARARARQALAGASEPSPVEAGDARCRPSPIEQPGGGVFRLDRRAAATDLAAALVCAGGGDATPRGTRLSSLLQRLWSGEDFIAVLVGARLEADADRVTVMREPGEYARGRLRPPVEAGKDVLIWDGRFEVAAPPGRRILPGSGRLASLPDTDRARLAVLPPAARGALPVLVGRDEESPLLAWGRAGTRSLAEERLTLALGETTHEAGLVTAPHGAKRFDALFWDETCWAGDRGADRPWTEEQNEPA